MWCGEGEASVNAQRRSTLWRLTGVTLRRCRCDTRPATLKPAGVGQSTLLEAQHHELAGDKDPALGFEGRYGGGEGEQARKRPKGKHRPLASQPIRLYLFRLCHDPVFPRTIVAARGITTTATVARAHDLSSDELCA